MPRNRQAELLGNAHRYRCADDLAEIKAGDPPKCDLYFIRMDDDLQPIKIGKSFASGKRHRILQCGSPYPLTLVGILFGEGHFEADWHERFGEQRMLGEWFRPTPELHDAIEVATREGSRAALGLAEPETADWRSLLGERL